MKLILFSFFRLCLILAIVYIAISHLFWYTINPVSLATADTFKQTQIILASPLTPSLPNQNLVPITTWSNLNIRIDEKITPLILSKKTNSSQPIDYLWYNSNFALISASKENKWQLVSCQTDLKNCQITDIFWESKLRIKLDKNQVVFGKKANGQYFNLTLEGYFKSDNYNFYPLL